MPETIAITPTIERKQLDLPRYVIVPSAVIQPWMLTETTVIEGTLNGASIGRRTIKHWDDERWFIEIPETLCRLANVDTGDTVQLDIRRASTDMPGELVALLTQNPAAKSAWDRLSASQQRMLREHVASAKNAETRSRRASGLLRW